MAFDSPSPADVAALAERRAQVRAWSLRIAEAVEAMPLPESYRDGERAARAIIVADRMLIRLPDPDAENETISPARQRLRVRADEVFAAVEDLPLPRTFMDGERAGRCVLATERLFTQLYTPPKPARPLRDLLAADPASEPHSEDDDTPEIAVDIVFDNLDRLAFAHACEVGFYPDGSPCDPAAPVEMRRLSCPGEEIVLKDWIAQLDGRTAAPGENILPLARIIAARANASTRAAARHLGEWPDGSTYRDDAPEFWTLSKAFPNGKPPNEKRQRPGPGDADSVESPGPSLFPWWLVRNPDTG
jgi:hypothetical protein